MAGERQARDVWAIGAAYESYVGRWSRLVADELLRWVGVPSNSRWLDVGCGTGTLVEAIRDFDDYWSPFLGGQGPAPAYAMSLPEVRRVALREAIRASLPIASDGSIPLAARAWAVRGYKAEITAPG